MSRPKRKKGGPPRTRGEGGGAKLPDRPTLAVLIDGMPLPDEEARDLWMKFSTHMDENQGDLTGFARQQGFASVAPEYRKGQAVLVVRRNPLN